jgi:hypothetical protein
VSLSVATVRSFGPAARRPATYSSTVLGWKIDQAVVAALGSRPRRQLSAPAHDFLRPSRRLGPERPNGIANEVGHELEASRILSGTYVAMTISSSALSPGCTADCARRCTLGSTGPASGAGPARPGSSRRK